MEKETIYKKWWAWCVLFLMTATVVYMRDRNSHTYVENNQQMINETMKPVFSSMVDFPKDMTETAITTWQIDVDLAAGEYFVLANENKLGYVLVTRNERLNPETLIWQKYIENHSIMTFESEQFVTLRDVQLIPIDEALVPGFEDDRLQAGSYRIGIDIPSGMYTFFPETGKVGYLFVATSSIGIEAHIIRRETFDEPLSLVVNDGDYLTFMRATIRR